GRAIGAVLEMRRERGEVGLLAREHDRLRWRLDARHLDDLRWVAQAALDLMQQLARLDAERARYAAAAAGDVGRKLLPLGADRAKHDRTRVAFEHLGDVGEINGI